ncbi:MAG: Smr/MutS family protein [Flavobacteriales bacterium]|jgi:hypothetical protein
MYFTAGEKVSLLNETGIYTLLGLSGPSATVLDEHGFERKVDRMRLVKRIPMVGTPVNKDGEEKREVGQIKKEERLPQIDLHAEALGLLNYPPHELLSKQVEVCRAFINQSIKARSGKVLIVHGVGDGTLRNAIRQMLQQRKGISCHDGNYSARGVGSTLVILSVTQAETL